ncbi:hypothetical protein NIES2109_29000 [Nostoc sp. HK-01]|nr:hypothetical protein NIES2109_29000 [Nostoc sp. HK-01]
MIKAIAQSREEESDRPNQNPNIDKSDRPIPRRRKRSPLYKPQQRSINIMMAQLPKSAQSKLAQFLGEDSNSFILNQISQQPFSHREPIKHLLIGSPKAVTSTIHYLQVIGYASVGDWSPLLPTANPAEVMSILTRSILMQ